MVSDSWPDDQPVARFFSVSSWQWLQKHICSFLATKIAWKIFFGCIIQQWSTFMRVFFSLRKTCSQIKGAAKVESCRTFHFWTYCPPLQIPKVTHAFCLHQAKALVRHVCIRTPTHQTKNSFTWIALTTCCLLKNLFLITRIYTFWSWNSLPPCVSLV